MAFDLNDLKKNYRPWHFMAVVGAAAAIFTVWFYMNGTSIAPDRGDLAPPQDNAGSMPPLLSSAHVPGNKVQVTIRPKISALAIVQIMDSKNKLVKVLFKGKVEPGEYTYDWNKKDEMGKAVAPGKYHCIVKYPDIHMETRSGLDVQ